MSTSDVTNAVHFNEGLGSTPLDTPLYDGDGSDHEQQWEQQLRETLEGRDHPQRTRTKSQTSSINLNTDLHHPSAQIVHPITQYHEKSMEQVVVGLCITAAVVAIFNFLRANIAWSVVTVAVAAFALRRRTEGLKDDFLAHMDRRRVEAFQSPESAGESSEWINSILKKIWPILNTDLFASLMDLLEDTIKKESPAIVHSVRIEDLDLGSNALRILSVKILPDSVEIGGARRHEEGDFISLEVEFSYRRLPPPAPKASNTHFVAYFALGKKFASFDLPVLVELRGAIGRVRMRIQLISDPPFVRHAFIAFPHLPEISVVAKPLRSTIDLMNVPILSHIVQRSIRDVLRTFTYPEWYSLDCSKLLVGSDVNLTTHSTGVICVVVHCTSDLRGPDVETKSDGYVSVGLAKFGKPLYSTRVIRNDVGHSHFEEACFIRVMPDDGDDGDEVHLTVWDSDGVNADDALGRAEISLEDLFKLPSKLHRHRKPLVQVHRRPIPQGEINFSIGFFPLSPRDIEKPGDAHLPHRRQPILFNRNGEAISRAGLYSERIKDALGSLTAPDRELPSGILAIQIHQLANLEIPTIRGAMNSRKRTNEPPPSTYCQVFVNDEKIFNTRLKKLSAAPYINASCEVFCRDWTTARIDITVMEAREKDRDAIIGTVTSPLSDLLQDRSQKTLWHSLTGGVGYGRIRLSVLFRSVAISIPPSLRSWNIGTLVISGLCAQDLPKDITLQVEAKVGSATAMTFPADSKLSSPSTFDCSWALDPPLRIPVLHRHQDAAVFRVTCDTNDSVLGEAVVWLSTVVDGEPVTISSSIYAHNLSLLAQNNFGGLPDITWVGPKKQPAQPQRKTKWCPLDDHKTELSRPVSTLEIDMTFEPGLSPLHRNLLTHEASDSVEEFRAWDYNALEQSKQRSKTNFVIPSPSHTPRTPNASQPTSRRSSWTSLNESSGWSDSHTDDKHAGNASKGWLARKLGKHQRAASMDAKLAEEPGKAKTPKTVKWMKDSRKRISRIGRSNEKITESASETEDHNPGP